MLNSYFFFFNLILFIYFWLHWVFVAVRRLSLVVASGGYSSLPCAGFSLQWLRLLRSTGSRCAGFSSCGSRALECRLSSCGPRAWLLCGTWDLPGPGLEPVSPELAGGFLTTGPPGSPSLTISDYLPIGAFACSTHIFIKSTNNFYLLFLFSVLVH